MASSSGAAALMTVQQVSGLRFCASAGHFDLALPSTPLCSSSRACVGRIVTARDQLRARGSKFSKRERQKRRQIYRRLQAVDGETGGASSAVAPSSEDQSLKDRLWSHVLAVREASPLVHNITNHVVMNTSANALLAVGASPIMSYAYPEMEQLPSICQSMVVNIGTLDEYKVESMFIAAGWTVQKGKPWVLDPVGAGATQYRDAVLDVLLDKNPTVVRGNASEIIAVARICGALREEGKAGSALEDGMANRDMAGDLEGTRTTKGVDSIASSNEALEAAKKLHQKLGCVVCISGATDIVLGDTHRTAFLSNGDALMTRVTGLGCSLSAVTGAFVAVVPDKFEATVAAAALFGVAGELAADLSPGPGTLQLLLLDKLYNISREEFMETLRFQPS